MAWPDLICTSAFTGRQRRAAITAKSADEELLPLIRRVVDERPTYGYRRVNALVNRLLTAEGKPTANHKRVFRIMKQQDFSFSATLVVAKAACMTAKWW